MYNIYNLKPWEIENFIFTYTSLFGNKIPQLKKMPQSSFMGENGFCFEDFEGYCF